MPAWDGIFESVPDAASLVTNGDNEILASRIRVRERAFTETKFGTNAVTGPYPAADPLYEDSGRLFTGAARAFFATAAPVSLVHSDQLGSAVLDFGRLWVDSRAANFKLKVTDAALAWQDVWAGGTPVDTAAVGAANTDFLSGVVTDWGVNTCSAVVPAATAGTYQIEVFGFITVATTGAQASGFRLALTQDPGTGVWTNVRTSAVYSSTTLGTGGSMFFRWKVTAPTAGVTYLYKLRSLGDVTTAGVTFQSTSGDGAGWIEATVRRRA